MKYISVDVETTEIDPKKGKLLQVAMIVEDTDYPMSLDKTPHISVSIVQDEIYGNLHAIAMNADLLVDMSEWKKLASKRDMSQEEHERWKALNAKGFGFKSQCHRKLINFLEANEVIEYNHHDQQYEAKQKVVIAGKNPSFDLAWIEHHLDLGWKVNHRTLDPGLLLIDWGKDEHVPGLGRCKERAGIPGGVCHTALQDAWDVVLLLRMQYVKKGRFDWQG